MEHTLSSSIGEILGLNKGAQAKVQPPGPEVRAFDDYDSARKNIFDNAIDALSKRFPLEDDKHVLKLSNVRLSGPVNYDMKQQRDAILKDRQLTTPIAGTWQLFDKKTGDKLDEKDDVVMQVPWMTPRGTFINNGNEYVVINQSKLKPGVYTRRKTSGEYEAQFNVKSGTGPNFRLWMEPETGIFRFNIGQSNIPLYPLMKMLGAADEDMEKLWGPDILRANRNKVDRNAQTKIFERLLPRAKNLFTDEARVQALRESVAKYELDPYVVGSTLGVRNAAIVTPPLMLRAAQKLLHISQGKEDVDDRDDLRFSSIHAVEDLVRERIDRDAGRSARSILYKISRDRNLGRVGRGVLNGYMDSLMYNSGLAMPLEETNPLQLMEQAHRITKFGEGGIQDENSIIDSARDVNLSQLGLIDPVSGPESARVGIDVRATFGSFKGRDGRIYGEFINSKTGQKELMNPETLSGKVIAFPGRPDESGEVVAAVNGRIKRVKADQVDYTVPTLNHMFSGNLNLVNMPTGYQPTRGFYSSKYFSQYIPLEKGEAPLVQTMSPDGVHTFHELYGRRVGAVEAPVDGTVVASSGSHVRIKDEKGDVKTLDMVTDFPFNRMTAISYMPTVKVGDVVRKGQLVAHSNFTDSKTGALNMGRNLKVAVMPFKGYSYEDAYVLSESAAKKMATERMYAEEASTDNETDIGKNKFMSLFPKAYDKRMYGAVGDDGVVLPGTVVQKGDPLILATRPRTLSTKDAMLGKLHRILSQANVDSSVTYDHDEPGVVIDSVRTRSGAKVFVKSISPVKEGDKLCMTADHDMLTDNGWVPIKEVKPGMHALTIDDDGRMKFCSVTNLHTSYVDEYMYEVCNKNVSLFVTGNHRVYAAKVSKKTKDVAAARPTRKTEGGQSLHNGLKALSKDILATQVYASRFAPEAPPIQMPCKKGLNYIRNISQPFPARYELSQIRSILEHDNLYKGAGRNDSKDNEDVTIHMLQYIAYKLTHEDPDEEHIGTHLLNTIWSLSSTQSELLVAMAMDELDSVVVPTRKHADMLSIAITMANGCSNVTEVPVDATEKVSFRVSVVPPETMVDSNKHVKQVKYRGPVYGPEVPPHHVVLVRRNGKVCWTGNSNMSASKGVVGKIVSDSEMPCDPVTKEPYDLLFNPMMIVSRVAPNQLAELQLAKIAKKLGTTYRVPSEAPPEGWLQYAKNELAKNNVKEREDVFDPMTGRMIKSITTGHMYFSAFHHLAEKKTSGRSTGSYDINEQPVKGSGEYAQAQRFGMLDLSATLAHNAPAVIKDALLIRGAKNEAYWKALKYGRPIPEPSRPFVNDKFFALLSAGGINVSKKGDILSLMPMTDDDINKLAENREVQHGRLVSNKLEPIEGGLFDVGITGGPSGNKWSKIKLHEPLPNPIMEEPIRKLLGLTDKMYRGILSGKDQLNGKTGGVAIRDALKSINVEQEIEVQRRKVAELRGANRDNAVKALGYLSAVKKMGLSPDKWVISSLPVIPPIFRPVSRMGNINLVSDINELYTDVAELNGAITRMGGKVGGNTLSNERERLYDAVTAAMGLGQSINPEGKAKNLKGAVKIITGDSPKTGLLQSRLLSKPVDLVGRAVIVPDPNLDMDQVGLPEEKAWKLFKPFVMRRLVRRGYMADKAITAIEERTPLAKSMLLQEMSERPVILDRAPAWHKFNFLGFYAKPVPGDVMRISPLINTGFNADFDGDTMAFHVPSSEKAVQQVKDKMMPSKNLFRVTDMRSVQPMPSREFAMGLYMATRKPMDMAVAPQRFQNVEQAMRAYRTGKVSMNTAVEV